MSMNYHEALGFLFPRTTTIKFGLDTTSILLESLGHPETVYPTIHVGGAESYEARCRKHHEVPSAVDDQMTLVDR